jgi:hypothetical protein
MIGKTIALTAGICLWSAFGVLAENSPAAEPGAAPQMVAALFWNSPQVFSDLEKIAGPIGRDRSIWEEAMGPFARARADGILAGLRVQLAIDFYHFDPREEKDPQLASYDLHFREGRSLLEFMAGPPEDLSDSGIQVLRFKGFYFREAGTADGFTLSWFLQEPDFAIPHRTAEETRHLVAGLAAILREGISRKAVEQHLGKLAPDPDRGDDYALLKGSDWELRMKSGKGQAVESIVFSTHRPIPGDLLVEALRLKEPGVLLSCSHWCSRTVAELDGSWQPRAHGYEIDIELSKDANLVKVDLPLGLASYYLARDYPVESLEISSPR